MAESAPNMVALVEILAKAIVEVPNEVEVEPFEENGQTVLELIVAESDLGRVIGRQGRTARSLRTIVHAASLRTRKRYQLEIVE
ncbi:MAG: KH domain-containing protein [Candidatus Korobacteraceae bacterium]